MSTPTDPTPPAPGLPSEEAMKASKESLNAAFEIQKSIAGNPESFSLVASALAIDRHFADLRSRLAAAEGELKRIDEHEESLPPGQNHLR